MGGIQAETIKLIIDQEKLNWADDFILKCSAYYTTILNVSREEQ
jgi:hypothetical protein